MGVSAYIDSGKTTLTERILYYTGRIRDIHEETINAGAKIDSMELEREKGITIQRAATFCHVDFTIQVERALRVLDSPSQTITVGRQMQRYNVPRLSFITRWTGANPWRLRIPTAAVQVPIGVEDQPESVVDLVSWKATYKKAQRGEHPRLPLNVVQPLLHGICVYLASPAKHEIVLEEGRFGQLTDMRVYQGNLKKGQFVFHGLSGKRIKVPRLDIDEIGPGEIYIFTDGASTYSMVRKVYLHTSMFVPDPVISPAIKPIGTEIPKLFSCAQPVPGGGPTFRVHVNHESKETITSGVGTLHLEIYVERMKHEYDVAYTTGRPQVAFCETATDHAESGKDIAFESVVMSRNVPSNYIPAVEKGFYEALEKGTLSGNPISGVCMVLRDGAFHAVDSSELAFRAAIGTFRGTYLKTKPVIFEPIMIHDGGSRAAVGGLNARRETIIDSEVREDGFIAIAEVALNDMFGYSSQLRGATQGKGEFSMEYKNYMPVLPNVQAELQEAHASLFAQEQKVG
ncbi:hypothetical protein BJV78DRAFT_1273464 [Lactifluus subvellereus]|nr:hypothetical protein BJV78DRAFT_1273464 [Lactifluus subvellereus]